VPEDATRNVVCRNVMTANEMKGQPIIYFILEIPLIDFYYFIRFYIKIIAVLFMFNLRRGGLVMRGQKGRLIN